MYHFKFILFMALTSFQYSNIESYKLLLKDKDFGDILDVIREKKFSRKYVTATPRELNYWKSMDLLYEDYDDSKWKMFSIVDIIWIQIIIEFRKYELPLSILKKIKQNLKIEFDLFAIFQDSTMEVFESTKAAMSSEIRDQITLNDVTVAINEMTTKLKPKDYFELIVIESYLLKHQYRLTTNFDGMCLFYTDLYHDEFLASESYKLYFENSNISLSVNALISSVFKDYMVSDLALNWKLISSEEVKILEIIQQQKNIKSINIRFNENSEVSLLEIVEEIKMTPQDYLKKIIVEGSYLDIRIITQNGNIVLCEKTTKKKI